MVAHVKTFSITGIDVIDIDVQVHIASGLPAFNIVGLPSKAVAESKERIRSAIYSLGMSLPAKRITVNLSPSDIYKDGSYYDLAITFGILTCLDVIDMEMINNYIVMGELSLDGRLSRISGVLSASIGANSKNLGIICPLDNFNEAVWGGNEDIIASSSLLEVINHLTGKEIIKNPQITNHDNNHDRQYLDLKDIKGQYQAKRALEVAAAGNHNMLMIGSPGSGKSMLAQRIRGILPPIDSKDVLTNNMIRSVSGLIDDDLLYERPFRSPHSTCSMVAMVGGGVNAKPGEISLAHGGVLFLDELPEFNKNALEALRQPLETGNITISRANYNIDYPAKFQLIAAMNPCKCGYLYDLDRVCSKAPRCGDDYINKISGPIFDRIDITIQVNNIDIMSIENDLESESSAVVLKRVLKAREIQSNRYKEYSNISTNNDLEGETLDKFTQLNQDVKDLLYKSIQKMKLSMRAYSKILKVARTIADLDNSKDINKKHIAEAISYRRMR